MSKEKVKQAVNWVQSQKGRHQHETPNKITCSAEETIHVTWREVTPEPQLPLFRTVDVSNSNAKVRKRRRCSFFSDPNIVQPKPRSRVGHIERKTVESAETITRPRKTSDAILGANPLRKFSAPIKGNEKGLDKPDIKVYFEHTENKSYISFSDTQASYTSLQNSRALSLGEFLGFWDQCLIKLGPFECTEDIERQQSFREASLKFNGKNQDTAHYGRTLFEASQKIFELTGLQRDEIFLDLGHGIGNATIQAAVTIGCEGRGLELVENRFSISLSFRETMCNLISAEAKKMRQNFILGKIDLRQGDFCDKSLRSFITEADVILVNNAFEIFAARSQSRTNSASLDDHIAGIFAQMKPGSRMVTLYPLPLGLSLTDANNQKKNLGAPKNENASFFECKQETLGSASVSWSSKETTVYIYTRVKNTFFLDSPEIPMFTCENEKCQMVASVLCETTGLLIKNCTACMRKRSVTGIRKAARLMKQQPPK